jgi:hypothetical protein
MSLLDDSFEFDDQMQSILAAENAEVSEYSMLFF